jgi:uncharacterized protein involved in cysteine biosynthesis
MHSGSALYQLLLVLVMFGGFSVMLCFVFLLPAVGNWLAAVFTATFAEEQLLKRKNEDLWIEKP